MTDDDFVSYENGKYVLVPFPEHPREDSMDIETMVNVADDPLDKLKCIELSKAIRKHLEELLEGDNDD